MNTETKAKKPEKAKQSAVSELFDYLEIFVFAACAVLLLFTFSLRLCRVDGDSMYNTLENGQMLMLNDILYTPEQGDIVVFHQSNNRRTELNKPLVKRVVATGGQFYKIEYALVDGDESPNYYKMNVYVSDDEVFDESERMADDFIDYAERFNTMTFSLYISKCTLQEDGVTYACTGTVPQDSIFVMGDNRFNSNDSRLDVGFVDVRCVLGKVLFRVTPPGSVY